MSEPQNFVGAVPAEWTAAQGAWFADAAKTFATPDLQADYRKVAERFAKGDDGACFIDTETLESFARSGDAPGRLLPSQRAAWRQCGAILQVMQTMLMQQLMQGNLRAYGARIGGDFEWIRAQDWWDLKPDPARSNTVCAGDIVYRFVRVVDPMNAPQTPQAPAPAQAVPLPPFDKDQAAYILAGMKRGGRLPQRPTPQEAQDILSSSFDHSPRDPVIQIVRKLWGEGKRGPRNQRNSSTSIKAQTISSAVNPRISPRK